MSRVQTELTKSQHIQSNVHTDCKATRRIDMRHENHQLLSEYLTIQWLEHNIGVQTDNLRKVCNDGR